MQIHESAEDYLENILILSEERESVRAIDIVNKMNFSKPSVSVAMKRLREEGKITVDENGFITLTETGREIAETIYARHKLFTKLLMIMGVDEETASEEACHMEHDISQDTFEKIRRFVDEHGFVD